MVCDLTDKTAGNADGIGIADFCTRRLVDKIDFAALHANALAGAEPEHAKIPLTLDTDRCAIQAAIDSVGLIPAEDLKVIRIRNTMQLERMQVSSAYLDAARQSEHLEVLGPPEPLALDEEGNLLPLD